MASENFNHLNPGINLVPNATTKVAVPGDMDYSSDTGEFNFFDATGAHVLVTDSGAQTLTNKTIPVGSNHIIATPNRAAQFNSGSGDLEASSVTNTELGFVSGVTSSIQAQLNTANISPAHTFKGNNTGSSGATLNLTQTQLTAELNLFSSGLQGLVPASGGGTTNFLRADGTFASPGTAGANTALSNLASTAVNADILPDATSNARNLGLVGTQWANIWGQNVEGTVRVITPLVTNLTSPLGLTGSTLVITASAGISINQIATPANPSAGSDKLYFKSDNNLYMLTSAGVETQVNGGAASNPQIAWVKDQKANSTNGGTFTSGAWRVRDLNTLTSANSPSWITNNGTDNFTLDAGTYDIQVSAPGYNVDDHKCKLVNTTDVSDALIGSSEFSGSAGSGVSQTNSLITGTITIAGTKSFQVQHRCITTFSGSGFGNASFFGTEVEVYTQVKITKIG